MTTITPIGMAPDGRILVDYQCDDCGRSTAQHPSMVVHPVRPIPPRGTVRHRCDGCADRSVRDRPLATQQLVLGGKPR